ncbi:MAG: hypothetical protein ACLUD2_05235 [Clostridium sp.]
MESFRHRKEAGSLLSDRDRDFWRASSWSWRHTGSEESFSSGSICI